MCSEHLSTRLRISKIIRSSKQRGGLGQSPANLFDLRSHIAKSTRNWEKQAVESELWKQNWGLPGFLTAVFWDGEWVKPGWAVPAASKLPQTLLSSPFQQWGLHGPPGILPAQLYTHCWGTWLRYLVASVTWSVSQSLLMASLQ